MLGPCFIKSNSEPYRQIYDNYKHRLENIPAWAVRTKGHRHNASIRYMVKRFLADLYVAWRKLEGLPVAPDYHEAKLGHKHRDERSAPHREDSQASQQRTRQAAIATPMRDKRAL